MQIFSLKKDFSTVPNFLKFNRGIKCRQKCGECKTVWKETGTEAVNIVNLLQREPLKTDQKFVCDQCFIKFQNQKDG